MGSAKMGSAQSTIIIGAKSMKITKEKAAENREMILTQAARLFRERESLGSVWTH